MSGSSSTTRMRSPEPRGTVAGAGALNRVEAFVRVREEPSDTREKLAAVRARKRCRQRHEIVSTCAAWTLLAISFDVPRVVALLHAPD
jgi:hypothetical protein